MKKVFLYTLLTLAFCIGGCSYFEDPTIDKDGNKIPLIMISTPEFPTQIDIMISNQNGERIYEPIRFKIESPDSANLINLAGQKNTSSLYSTASSQYTLYLDPNIVPSESRVLELDITDPGNGNKILIPACTRISKEGRHLINVCVFDPSLISTSAATAYGRTDLTGDIVVKAENGTVIAPTYELSVPMAGKYSLTAYYAALNGKYTAESALSEYGMSLADGAISLFRSGNLKYQSVFTAYKTDCDLTMSPEITFKSAGEAYFNSTYVITTKKNGVIQSGEISGDTKKTVHLPALYYSADDKPQIQIQPSHGPFELKTGTFELKAHNDVELVPAKGDYTTYHIKIQLYDPSTPEVLVSPSLGFQYKLAKEGEKQIFFSLKNGEAELQFIKDQDYIFSVVWDGELKSSDPVPTNPARIQEFLKQQAASSNDFKIDEMTIVENASSVDFKIKVATSVVSEL